MPIYEYQCQACDESLEKLQKMNDDALTLCPNCGEETLKKQISAVGFRLKGTGWYETDFKGGKKKNISESDGSNTKKESKEKKTENKKTENKTKITKN